MAREKKFVSQEQCERCPRKIERVMTLDELVLQAKQAVTDAKPIVAALRVEVGGEEVCRYDVLCDECKQILSNQLQLIMNKPEKVSSGRTGTKKVKPEEAAKEKAEVTPPSPPPQAKPPAAPAPQQKPQPAAPQKR